MPTFEVNGVSLAYEDSGETDLRPIVFLHGLSQASSTWARIIPPFAGRWRVLTLDQRGHGDSAHAPGTYTLAHYGPDTEAFCECIVGEPAVLVGHSLGGVVGAWVARARPDLVRGIFLEDPPLFRALDGPSREPSGVATMFPVVRQVLRDMRDRNAPLAEYETMVRAVPALNRTGRMMDNLGEAGMAALARSLATLDPEIFTPAVDGSGLDGADPATPLRCPVFIARADPAFGPAFTTTDEERFVATNPHAVVEVFEGASHAIHDEQSERFQKALVSFLETLDR